MTSAGAEGSPLTGRATWPRAGAAAIAVVIAMTAALLATGCPRRAPATDNRRCPDGQVSTVNGGWSIVRAGEGWVVCRQGQIRYRGPSASPAPSKLATTDAHHVMALLEQQGGRCEVVVLQEVHDPPVDPVRLPVPRCEPTWVPHFVDRSTVTLGPSVLDPKVQIRLERE